MTAAMTPWLLALTMLAPLLLMTAIALGGGRSGGGPLALVLRLAPLTALPALLLALLGQEGQPLALPWLLLGTELALDATGRPFLLLSAWLWLLATWFAGRHLAGDPRPRQFFLFLLAAMAGNFGLIVAQDLVSFNVCFTLMSLSAYGLVIHRRDPAALRAGRIYLVLVILGEVAIFIGLIGLVYTAGGLLGLTPAGAAATPFSAFFLLGFAIKAGLPPLHFWLPLAHPAAPIPASSVLSGAMIKAGLLGWLRFLPPGESTLPEWGLLLLLLGLFAAFYGAVVGLRRNEPKTVLAWSSISQMGLITAGLGLGLAVPAAYPETLAAVQVYAVHHGLAKGALFLAVGVVGARALLAPARTGGGGGWSPAGVLLALGVLLPALSLAGAPGTSGFLAKGQLLAGGQAAIVLLLPAEGAGALWGPRLFNLLLSLSSVLTALLLIHFLALLGEKWRRPGENAAGPGPPAAAGSGAAGLLLPWGLLVISGLPLFWPLLLPAELLPTAAAGGWAKHLGALAPILLALLLAGLIYGRELPYGRASRRERERPDQVGETIMAADDKLAGTAEEAGLLQIIAAWEAKWREGLRGVAAAGERRQRHLLEGLAEISRRVEERLASWSLAGCSCLLLIFLFFFGLL
jgi:hydrogenase-4 component B